MNEIEKMYSNVNLTNLYCGDDYVAERMLEFECTDGDKEKCKTCDKVKTNYPPFTAEKQLELIKWLIKYDELHADFNDNEYGFSSLNYSGNYKKDFVEALASVINREIWQDLTEEERKQIKEILAI